MTASASALSPTAKLVIVAGIGFAWGVAAQRLCVAAGYCDRRARGPGIGHAALGVAVEELTYRVPLVIASRALPQHAGTALALQSVAFGLAHAHPVIGIASQAGRVADAAAGGLFYGVVAQHWGLGYAFAAHLAHNFGVYLATP